MKTIVIVCRDVLLNSAMERSTRGICRSVLFSRMTSALDYIYNSIPNLVVIHVANDDPSEIDIINDLKTDPLFHPLPVLAILPDQFDIDRLDALMVEDFIWRADFERDFLARVKLSMFRSEKIVEINPLTRLPGNISISREIQERLDEKKAFALGYADLNNFKPFNDRYGFSGGDEVIKMTGRLILGIVKAKQPQRSFVGHIGGDDFVFIIDAELAEEAAAEIIQAFDSLIPGCYDREDSARGFIQSSGRKGGESRFPVMGLSIGITETCSHVFSHYGEVSQLANEMKKFAKRFNGSCFKSDRRRL
ncbi:MAG: diguanylate cyclase [Deltaproteobacteria bacterium]|nr:diguanylate cyclase [Deltaproteobacteria bacterium]